MDDRPFREVKPREKNPVRKNPSDDGGFRNSYEDTERARAYAGLEFPGTYYLAYRDLPEIIWQHVKGREAMDFGCGAGRSTRFLKRLGFHTVGVDISTEMLRKAREIDPEGDYRIIEENTLSQVEADFFDLVLCAFTFDNIPTMEKKIKNFKEIRRILKEEGRIVNLVSSPEIYTHEWASFSTKDFPENLTAKSGEKVRIIQTDLEDKRPVEDVICSEGDYRRIYGEAGLEIAAVARPLAREDEPYSWINETRIPPWTIYVLKKRKAREAER
ncbi:MAG: class I SAM-dependent methyltransferase [Theionarchaea archaeon]|nr:class I SAM-dependent methyltransferase [Theionarchaea archaeon]MBU6999616.1 class I SAM-dependent methyltransferase [Theionarchaea archaeon]MBU7020380.1 class I SAM-dependent methyltransferase [Theionarchaea archaeon]MBU7035328.1 class I SAM-dependent methyltransferase [Theionarchaea archaeon]MBU7041847.1 class I SAM-dependent methyltransferase [Theionarchaea archaeon]